MVGFIKQRQNRVGPLSVQLPGGDSLRYFWGREEAGEGGWRDVICRTFPITVSRVPEHPRSRGERALNPRSGGSSGALRAGGEGSTQGKRRNTLKSREQQHSASLCTLADRVGHQYVQTVVTRSPEDPFAC